MASEVERFLFGEDPAAHFVERFEFASGIVSVRFRPFEPDDAKAFLARFDNATMVTIEQEPKDEPSPLDIIGLDCYPGKPEWEFVLNCDSVEWSWTSAWPSIQSE